MTEVLRRSQRKERREAQMPVSEGEMAGEELGDGVAEEGGTWGGGELPALPFSSGGM